ncbi:hypothetical protein WA1_47280 [Scytonema hofmannii PCC 7110]|uniref:Squalene cyclase C-terminal domain-containing protein n=1 Tax=Scytonema hofmannii PCC 7110 TaxID=128403 RepID=A0A139WXX3_9CYAN|nr:hypothetical protein [Scytonema hofmannii]KYC37232.1 hypothetical protein WA1_47280 [Scytonema hofmannii PCC 7110]
MLYSHNQLVLGEFNTGIKDITKGTLQLPLAKASIETAERALVLKPKDMALALLVEIAADDERWGGGEITASAYNTAWVAMVRDPHNPQQLAFPDSFNWLLKHQALDGSWGSSFPYTIVPTLASLLALMKAPEQSHQIHHAALWAKAYLCDALRQWSLKKSESIDFEVLVPNLLQELEKLGVVFEFSGKEELLLVYVEKLLIDAPKLIYNGQSSLISSLEAFGSSLDFKRLKQQQGKNGNYGNSPAATAAVLIYNPEWDTAAAQWLTHLSGCAFDDRPGAMPTAYPIDTFERAWVLYNLSQGGFNLNKEFPQPLLQKLVRCLQYYLILQTESCSQSLEKVLTHSDNIGMVLVALHKIGVNVSVDCLLHFEHLNACTCDRQNQEISVSANAHSLAALLSLPSYVSNNLTTSIKKAVDLLYCVRNDGGFWEDKKNLSPFYPTARAVMALTEHPDILVRNKLQPTIEWVLQTQSRSDGGWGYGTSSTLEETAYALQILQSVPDLIELSDYRAYKRAIHRGVGYLWQHLDEFSPNYGMGLPKLWVCKELYIPIRVVFSAVVAVLHRFGI